jgi:hypothetical protein
MGQPAMPYGPYGQQRNTGMSTGMAVGAGVLGGMVLSDMLTDGRDGGGMFDGGDGGFD